MKACTRCHRKKPLNEFGPHKLGVGGRQSRCKKCCNLISVARYVLVDGVSRRSASRKRYAADPKADNATAKKWRLDNPKRYAFVQQRYQSTLRGICFLLSFEEWVTWWGEDFKLRGGRQPDELQMCRYDDEGPYRIGNIYMASKSENSAGPRPLPQPTW